MPTVKIETLIIEILLVCGFCSTVVSNTNGQKNDYIWEIGDASFEMPSDTSKFQSTRLDFNYDPVKITFGWEYRFLNTNGANSSYALDNGSFYCLTNRESIVGSDYEYMGNGDSIFVDDHFIQRYPKGGKPPQSVLILPYPHHPDSLLVIGSKYLDVSWQNSRALWICVIDRSKNNGHGIVVEKDKIISNHLLDFGAITAVRHANGEDWWLFKKGHKLDTQFIYLIDGDGVHFIQEYNFSMYNGPLVCQAYFSPNGSKFALIESDIFEKPIQIHLFDFDRCTGELSNQDTDTISVNSGLASGICFSPNGEYLYANNNFELFQYETEGDLANSKVKIADFDGHKWGSFGVHFGYMANAPDGRIYTVPASSSGYLHVIDYPNEKGQECTFRQHGIPIKKVYQSIPNFPNYRLGPIDGSDCDVLGIDNMPIAKFRYEHDSMDRKHIRFTDLSYFRPEDWFWEFDDGMTFSGHYPHYHQYAEPGDYNVCLTVSNENGSDRTCRSIHIGDPTATSDYQINAEVSLYPNPATDYLLITLGDYIPKAGSIKIFNTAGQLVLSDKIQLGHNTVDVQSLAVGVYTYTIVDEQLQISDGQFVKN